MHITVMTCIVHMHMYIVMSNEVVYKLVHERLTDSMTQYDFIKQLIVNLIADKLIV